MPLVGQTPLKRTVDAHPDEISLKSDICSLSQPFLLSFQKKARRCRSSASDNVIINNTLKYETEQEEIFGEEAYYDNMKYIESTLGKSLRDYLYKDYYADHQQMYSVKGAKRPIYWLFSSRMGDKHKKGYFKALVYMHRMEADTLSKLHAEYVHPYINKVEQQLREAEEETLRDDLTQAQRNRALKLVNELKEKVKEVKEFEQELVEMASHRLTIDLDDGVKANYPKFYPLVEPIKGLE